MTEKTLSEPLFYQLAIYLLEFRILAILRLVSDFSASD